MAKKIRAEQTDGLAKIDGSNIPAGTFWNTLKAGGVGNYVYVDVQENDFTRVMVWKDGGWAWTNKDGFSSWLGLDALKADLENFGGRNYLEGENIMIVGGSLTKTSISPYHVKYENTSVINQHLMWNGTSGITLDSKAGEFVTFSVDIKTDFVGQMRIRSSAAGNSLELKNVDIPNTNNNWQRFSVTAKVLADNPIIWIYLMDYRVFNQFGSLELKNWKLEKGGVATDWTPALEDQITDWNETDSAKFSYLMNKPTLVNNYVESIITTNGTTAGTVYTFKRVGLSDLTLQLTAASAQFSGVVTTAAQQFEGPKEFLKTLTINKSSGSNQSSFTDPHVKLAVPSNPAAGNVVGVTFPVSAANNYGFSVMAVRGSNSSTGSFEIRSHTNSAEGNLILKINQNNGEVTLPNLAGVGYQMVVSDVDGVLQVQDIPIIPNGQLTVNTTPDLVGGYVYFPNGNVTTTLGLATHVLNAIADGQTAYSWGDFKNFGLGENAIATNNWDIIDKTGMYYNPNTNAIGAPTTQGLMTCFHLNINSSTAIQIANRSGGSFMWFRRKSAGVWQPWVDIYHSGNFNPAQYVMQSSLNSQLANYGTLAGTQTWTGQNTYTQALIVPNGTLNGHAVNLGQLNTILGDYATETWVTQQIANISIPNGQLTVNTTSDLVGGFVYLPNGNVTTTIGLSTAILNNIADGVTAYSWGNHANAGYTNLGAVQSWVNSQNFATSASIGNGTIIVQGVGAITGVVTFQLNQSGNAIGSFDLTPATKNDIQKGVEAESWGNHANAGYIDTKARTSVQHSVWSDFVVDPGHRNTIVNLEAAMLTVTLEPGELDGDKVFITPYGEYFVEGHVKYSNSLSTSTQGGSTIWIWIKEMGVWCQAG